MYYYFTIGPTYKKNIINEKFFYTPFNQEKFNLELIKNILLNEKINIDNIDNYHYYDSNKKGYIKINEDKNYLKPSNKFILECHYKISDPILYEFDNLYNDIRYKYKKLKNQIKDLNRYQNNEQKYDLIYLYASALETKSNEEQFNTINYRLEIQKILQLMTKSKKQFNCLFECANEKNFRNLIKKPTKILHISSHGYIRNYNYQDYYLGLEANGIEQHINKDILNEILKASSEQIQKIDLIIISTCYSQELGELFLQNKAKNVIYIHGYTEISNLASVKFTEYFYKELIKGNNIKTAFNKSIDGIKLDRMMLYSKPNNSCKSHKHKDSCNIKGNTKYNDKCDCKYEEFNIHRKDCNFIGSLIKNEMEKKKYTFKYYNNNCLKICCCCYNNTFDKFNPNNNNENKEDNDNNNNEEFDIPHSEYKKFILKSNKENKKEYENIILFNNNNEGKVIKNKNIIFFDKKKDFSIIGNRKKMKEIYDIITDNIEFKKHHLIVLYGPKQIGKQNFVESLCVYLFERKIIYYYSEIIEIENESHYTKIENEILKCKKYINSNQKYIIIGKISYSLNEGKSLELTDKILSSLNNIFDKNFYFIIILAHFVKPDIKTECKIINLKKLDEYSAKSLLENLCKFFGYENNIIINNKERLFKIIKYEQKKIYDIVQIICEGGCEEIENNIMNKINNEKIEENKIIKGIKKNKLLEYYFLLSIMPSGLPYSLIKLICPNIEKIMEEEDMNMQYKDNENWFHIIENQKKIIFDFIKKNNNIIYECISNCLKVYARLLFFYIQKNKKDICFPDNNIHYIFNSFNGKGLWKTFNEEIYNLCFPYNRNKNENKENKEKEKEEKEEITYNNILKDDLDLEKHKSNILYFIENNYNYIKSLISEENENKNINREYLEQILLMLPSCFFFNSIGKNIIKKCMIICDKQLNLKLGSKRLLLFLKSLENNPQIDEKDFEFDSKELLAEAYFLKGLKEKNKFWFQKANELYKGINNNELKEYRIPYIYYELASLFFCEKNYNSSKKYIDEAKKLAYKNNNNLLVYRCNVELILILDIENRIRNKEKKHNLLQNLKIINLINEAITPNINNNEKEEINFNFQKEPYELKNVINKYLEPDITILNSNPLNNNYSLLNSGIFAYHNNHYYFLQKLYEKLNLNLKVKSLLLNEYNCLIEFNNKGKILIIQSDDFSEDGEIVFETEMGESNILSNENLNQVLPEKIKYQVVILCFINSIKLKNIFKDKTQYLITFNEINYFELDYNTLLKYNELSIEFLINFIVNTRETNIEDSFEESKKIFIDGLKKIKIYKTQNYIDLKKPEYNINRNIKYEKNKFLDKEKIYLYYPILNLNPNARRNYKYSSEILNIVKEIIENKNKCITININKEEIIDPKKANKKMKKIGIEVMKFFHRHKRFNRLFCAFNHQDIIKINKEIEDIQENESILLLINDNIKKIEDPLESFDNVCYLIIENKELKVKSRENENLNPNIIKKEKKRIVEDKNDLFNDFDSIFTYKLKEDLIYKNEYSEEQLY